MFAAAAVCPHPPLLVPEVAAGAAAELDEVRQACDAALRYVFAARPDRLVVVGDAPRTGPYPGAATGSLRRYGVDVDVPLGPGPGSSDGEPELPLAHTLGGWLLHRSGWAGERSGYGVRGETPPVECARLGRELVAGPDRVGLLVLGDGSAGRTEKAPGYLRSGAAEFDAAVAAALADADTGALLDLDPARAAGLLAAGRAAWQVLAGAAAGSGCAGKLLHASAPYGVGYFVACWA